MPNSLYRLCALGVALGDALDRSLENAVGLGGSAPAALLSIHETPGLTVDDIAETVGITGSGAVRLLDRLQAHGLIERRAGDDGRVRRLHATSEGRRLAQRAFEARNATLDDFLAPLDAVDRDHLRRIVDLVLREVVTDARTADRTCRLCDLRDCPDDECPLSDVPLRARG